MSRIQEQSGLAFIPARAGVGVQLGYQPSWVWRQPPLTDTPPNFVYATFAAVPFDLSGPGDVPKNQRVIQQRATVAGSAFVQNGIPTTAGQLQAAPLTWSPMTANPAQSMFPGFG